jgi:hypothetical protein
MTEIFASGCVVRDDLTFIMQWSGRSYPRILETVPGMERVRKV